LSGGKSTGKITCPEKHTGHDIPDGKKSLGTYLAHVKYYNAEQVFLLIDKICIGNPQIFIEKSVFAEVNSVLFI